MPQQCEELIKGNEAATGMLQLQNPTAPDIKVLTISDSATQNTKAAEEVRIKPTGVDTHTPSPDPSWSVPLYVQFSSGSNSQGEKGVETGEV